MRPAAHHDPAHWKTVSDLVAQAADGDTRLREELFAQHPELRAEIESLLAFLEEGTGPLDRQPVIEGPLFAPGRRVGPYEVIRELGEGGMGVVLLARRADGQFEQTVAIKLLRAALQSDFYHRRFLEERQILARLEHPGIARLLDGGILEDGTPYLAMQYIDGEPLDRWCQSRNLARDERIRLVAQICGAVQYAHENLVVHRDLKPGNLLVDASGRPMLLDFGTARLLAASTDPAAALHTAFPMMTVRYASPEQTAGLTGSTRSDVYSLGVILYELLTARWPYGEAPTPPAQLRAIAEQEPAPPRLTPDLDAILLRALDKDPARRYGTAGALAADLERFLSGEPVEARPASFADRALRFVRRHRIAVAAATTAVLALSAATVVSIRQARIAERERQKAVEVALFTERLLGASRSGEVSPLATRGQDLRVAEVIDEAAGRIGKEFAARPDIEMGLRSTISGAYMALNQFTKAAPQVDRALALAESQHGPSHLATARALSLRARLRMAAGDYAAARDDLRRVIPVVQANTPVDLSFQQSLLGETEFRLGNLAAARTAFESALASMRSTFGTRHITTATMLSNLAVVVEETGDAAAAEAYFREAGDILTALPGPPGNAVYPLLGLQRILGYRGEFAAARDLCARALEIARKQGGDKSRNTAIVMEQLALNQAHLGDPGAEALARQSLALKQELFPPGHLEISRGQTSLGRVLLLRRNPREAARLFTDAYALARKLYPKDNWRAAEPRLYLAEALAGLGRAEDAEAEKAAARKEMSASLPAQHPRVQLALRD